MLILAVDLSELNAEAEQDLCFRVSSRSPSRTLDFRELNTIRYRTYSAFMSIIFNRTQYDRQQQ